MFECLDPSTREFKSHLVTFVMILAAMGYAVMLYKTPRMAHTFVKAGAFLLMPAAAYRGLVVWHACNSTQFVGVMTALFYVSKSMCFNSEVGG